MLELADMKATRKNLKPNGGSVQTLEPNQREMDELSARFELQAARAALEKATEHLRRASHTAGSPYKTSIALLIPDADHLRNRIERIRIVMNAGRGEDG
jgi:hypothetical protein